MSYKLTAEKILLNYFAANPNCMELAFSEIAELATRIVRKCDNSILAYITRDDIEYAVASRSTIFELDGAAVVLKDPKSSIFKNIDMLNQTIPEHIRKHCVKVCSDYAKKKMISKNLNKTP